MYKFDYSKLSGRIVEKYGTRNALIPHIKISKTSFSLKLNNKSEFNQKEIMRICEKLDIDAADIGQYFFCEV